MLGDRYGTSCAKAVTDMAEAVLSKAGYRVARNDPYAGGFTTRNYGRPNAGVHALQIEIKRSLYMDEGRIARLPGLTRVRDNVAALIETLASLNIAAL